MCASIYPLILIIPPSALSLSSSCNNVHFAVHPLLSRNNTRITPLHLFAPSPLEIRLKICLKAIIILSYLQIDMRLCTVRRYVCVCMSSLILMLELPLLLTASTCICRYNDTPLYLLIRILPWQILTLAFWIKHLELS